MPQNKKTLVFIHTPFITFLISLLFLLSFCTLTAQQKNNYNVTHYTSENGLPQNSITDMTMDANGFLWMTTQNGVCRFDGQKFRVYNTSNTPAFKGDRFRYASLSSQGQVILVQPITFKEWDYFVVTPDNRIVRDSILNNANKVALKLDTEPFVYTNLDSTKMPKGMFTYLTDIEYLWTVNNHEAYVYYNKTIYYINTFARQVKAILYTPANYKKLYAYEIPMILIGDVFLYTDTKGAITSFRNGQILKDPPLTSNAIAILKQTTQKNIKRKCFKSDNNVITFFVNESMYMLTYNDGVIDSHLEFEKTGLANFVISVAYEKESATTFIGTNTKGLYALKNKKIKTHIVNNGEMASNCIYAQMVLDNGDIINHSMRYNINTNKTQAFPRCDGYAFLKLTDGAILYSFKGKMLKANKEFTNSKMLGELDKFNKSYAVTCFMKDRQQKVWFSTQRSLGVVYKDSFTYALKEPPAFKYVDILTLFDHSEDTIWVGCVKGIYQYCKKANKFLDNLLLPGNVIRNIYRAHDNSIWIGTYGQGYYKYLNGKFIPMPLDAKRSLSIVQSFYEDKNGLFWLPTNNGLFACRKSNLDKYATGNIKLAPNYFCYTDDDGLATNEFNGGCTPEYVIIGDELFYPSMLGVVHFNPDLIRPTVTNNAIFVDEVLVDEHEMSPLTNFQLAPSFKRIEFTVVTPYFGKSENLLLEYKLDGLNDNWYPLNNNTIIFNSLPKGNYTLLIRKQKGLGDAGEYLYKKISFKVNPWWYQTWLFRGLTVLLIAFIMYLIFYLRLRWLTKQKEVLKDLVKQKTLALDNSVVNLNNTITELSQSEQKLNNINEVQEKAISIILHDIQSPLHYLSLSAQYFNKEVSKMSFDEINHYASSLAKSSYEINNFSRDLLQWLICKRRNFTPMPIVITVEGLLRDVALLYSAIAELNGNKIEIIARSHYTILADKNILKLIIRNLLDNANKNCTEGIITLSYKYSKKTGKMLISVSDTGKGLTTNEIEAILYDFNEDASLFKNGKLGFTLVRDFLKLINGEINIQSEKGKGTTITIGINLST